MFKGEIRPKTGSPTMFTPEMEADFTLYMKHCSYMRIPCTQTLLKEDIVHFVQYRNLQIKNMAEDGPGEFV